MILLICTYIMCVTAGTFLSPLDIAEVQHSLVLHALFSLSFSLFLLCVCAYVCVCVCDRTQHSLQAQF